LDASGMQFRRSSPEYQTFCSTKCTCPTDRPWERAAMVRASQVCSVPGCPTRTTRSRCDQHQRAADQARGTAAERSHTTTGHRRFRRSVLRRDPTCVYTDPGHGHLEP
jgi:hypothetical protein